MDTAALLLWTVNKCTGLAELWLDLIRIGIVSVTKVDLGEDDLLARLGAMDKLEVNVESVLVLIVVLVLV